MDTTHDVAFRRNKQWFRFRACGVVLHDGKILMATSNKIKFYYVVGGGVLHNETTEAAVIREVYEETGVMMDIDRLLFINENFFPGLEFEFGETLLCHELAFYYLMKYDPSIPINLDDVVMPDGSLEHLEWISLDEYAKIEAYPRFLADKLRDLKPEIEIIITRKE